jgi:hypothetical protein|tara:strand:- start:155 stop:370 length:216 start_codon:yes stop_codon:yes gene_type:complete
MKLNELISPVDVKVYMSNEERELLETLDDSRPRPMTSFPERDQVIINNLIRKSVISKVLYNGTVMVLPNVF